MNKTYKLNLRKEKRKKNQTHLKYEIKIKNKIREIVKGQNKF